MQQNRVARPPWMGSVLRREAWDSRSESVFAALSLPACFVATNSVDLLIDHLRPLAAATPKIGLRRCFGHLLAQSGQYMSACPHVMAAIWADLNDLRSIRYMVKIDHWAGKDSSSVPSDTGMAGVEWQLFFEKSARPGFTHVWDGERADRLEREMGPDGVSRRRV